MAEHVADPPRRVRSGRLLVVALAALVWPGAARAQEVEDQPLNLRGLYPAGIRNSVTESWGTLQFTVANPNTSGRDARVVVYYPERPDVQYARDVWVPPRATVTTWLTIGPAPPQVGVFAREYRMILIDRTGGKETVVLPPNEERVRSRIGLYRKREPTTALIFDAERADPGQPDPQVPPEVVTLARLPRAAVTLSEHVALVHDSPLPQAPEAFDGIDVFVIAGDRLAADPSGRAALRRWVENGGRVWVMLDRVNPDTIAPLLGEGSEIGVVDRVGLTTVQMRIASKPAPEPKFDLEKPVPFVRVLPAATDRVIVSIDGWPAAFVRRVGRGKIVFTTLGQTAWSSPRGTGLKDPPSPYSEFPRFPIPREPIAIVATELHPSPTPDTFPPDVFQPMLTDEIGYSIVGRGTAAGLLGGFVAALVGLGLVLRRTRNPVPVGGLLLGVAGLTVGAFVFVGERSRRSVPPTIGVAALVEPVAGRDESVVTGLYAVYHPQSGPITLGSRQDVSIGLDAEGLEGQARTRVQTDTGAWHWDGLALPAGARTGPLRTTLKTGHLTATARYGPNGIEGRLGAGAFRGLGDALVSTQPRDALAVRLAADGNFTCGPADVLAPGEYLTGAVLTDRQQRRQAVYRQLHTGVTLRHYDGRDLLMVWADPPDVPIVRQEGARLVGGVLLVVPIEFERTPANTAVAIPRGALPYRRVQDGKPIPATLNGSIAVDMRLRFQLPPSVLPLRVERATLVVQARAPFRRLTLSGVRDDKPVQLAQVTAPVDPVRVEITDPALLRLDEQGGLYLNVALSDPTPGSSSTASDLAWKIDSITLEVAGRTE